MIDLCEEFSSAVCSITPECMSELASAGISVAVISTLVVGLSPIETYRNGLYEAREEGPPAVLVPCGHHDGLSWQLEDLCAFYLARPERWWLRLGTGVLLGDIYRTSLSPRRVEPTPLAWLQGGATGFCVLDWAVDPLDLFAGLGDLVADQSLRSKLLKAAATARVEEFERIFSHAR